VRWQTSDGDSEGASSLVLSVAEQASEVVVRRLSRSSGSGAQRLDARGNREGALGTPDP